MLGSPVAEEKKRKWTGETWKSKRRRCLRMRVSVGMIGWEEGGGRRDGNKGR